MRVIYSTSLMVREMQIKTTMRYYFMPVRIATIKNISNNTCGEGAENRELLWTVGGSLNLGSHYGKLYAVSSKEIKKKELLYYPAIPVLCIHLKKTKIQTLKDTCIAMFSTALFIIGEIWKCS